MSSDAPATPPRVRPDLVDALRADLVAADYTVTATQALLGEVAVAALRREDPVPARRVLTSRTEPAAALMCLFTLGVDLPRTRVQAALPTLGVAGALELGLLAPAPVGRGGPGTPGSPDDPGAPGSPDDPGAPGGPDAPGGEVADPLLRATIDLSPYEATDDAGEISWWIASDRSELATGTALGPEHVLGVGGASLTLARITPRTRVGRVLDVGCGGGIQALHASRHADHVVATDLSERALAFAEFNAALNGIEIELRQGSLLEPVRGESFDLIVSNPPFVITPRSSDEQGAWVYRDGGRAGDALLGELLEQLPQHLLPGGRIVMLGNWEISAADDADGDWDAHPRRWLEPALAAAVDCWVIQRESEDPAQYAATWARDGGLTDRDARWPELIEAWLEDFAGRDVARIGFGYLLLHRPEHSAGRRGMLRTEQVAGTGSGTLSQHLTATLHMLDTLAEMDDAALGALRPTRATDVVERRHLTPGQFDPMLIELVQGGGFARVVPADQVLAATVGALDEATLTLDQTLAAVCALTDHDLEQTRQRVLPQLRELILTGMLEL